MDMTPRRDAFQAASFDHTTKNILKADLAARPERLVGPKLSSVLDTLKFRPKNGSGTLTEHVALSPRQPWVDGKGWLDALNPRSWFSDASNMGFVPENGQPDGRVEIWLHGLEPNASYLFQILVSSPGVGSFEMVAVTLGGGYAALNTGANGGAQTLLGMFETTDGGLGLIRVSNRDWVFYEAVVSKFD